MSNRLLIASLAALALVSTGAYAQTPGNLVEPGDPTSARPGILSRIAIDQRIGHQVPSDIPFVDENGRDVTLGDYFGKRPVVLALVYYECPMLCTQVLNGLVSALGVLNFEAGREFDVVAVSFNPKEGPGLASQKKAAYLERYGRPQSAAGWHFLTGSQASIDRLTDAVGFRYEYDEKIGQFAHGAAIEEQGRLQPGSFEHFGGGSAFAQQFVHPRRAVGGLGLVTFDNPRDEPGDAIGGRRDRLAEAGIVVGLQHVDNSGHRPFPIIDLHRLMTERFVLAVAPPIAGH